MKIDKNDLLHALDRVSAALNNKENIMDSFIFREGRVRTFNDEVSISHPTDLDIEGMVQADRFYKLINKMDGDTALKITQVDNEIQIQGENVRAGVRLRDVITFVIDDIDTPQNEWHKIPKNMFIAMQECLFCASKDTNKPVITCLYCDSERNAIYATDGYRISKVKFSEELKQSFLIPVTVVNKLIKYNFTHYQIQKNWGHFKDGQEETVFSFRSVAGDFPVQGIEEYFLDEETTNIKLPKNMSAILDRAGVFAQDQDVYIEIVGKQLTVAGQNEFGWIKEHCEIENKSEQNFKFLINSSFLQQILNKICTVNITESFVKFSNDNFKHLIILITDI